MCVLVLILLFLLLCLFFSFGFACYFSVHHFCCYMSRRTNSAGSMVWIHCWKCKVMIVIMIIIAIMIAMIRPISCDKSHDDKTFRNSTLLRLNPEVKQILTHELKNVCLLHCRNGPTAFLAQLLIYTTGYIYICVCVCVCECVYLDICFLLWHRKVSYSHCVICHTIL